MKPPPPHPCKICQATITTRAEVCPRCRRHITNVEYTAHLLALLAAWDPVAKGFRCFYTGVLLEENDKSDPWYLAFDHRIPGKKGDLVVCARWVNSMKTALSDDEFRAVIIELDRSRKAKEPFNMAVAEFKYWKGPADHKPKKLPSLASPRLPEVGECFVCDRRTLPHSQFCEECRKIAFRGDHPHERWDPLKAAWDEIGQCFVCYITGLEVEIDDRKDPRYITFDHSIPRQAGTLRVAVAFANMMKTDLSEEEFWLVVGELANHFRTGRPFNRDIIKFQYWKRPRTPRKGGK